MLAEIFMVRLEAAARVPEEMAPSSNTRFVPFTHNTQLTFKQSRNRLAERAGEVSSIAGRGTWQDALVPERGSAGFSYCGGEH